MPRRIVYSLAFAAFAAAAAGLVWDGWPGAPGNPATLINRADVIATIVLLAALPWVVRRRFGPVADGWRARIVRAGGYAGIFALVAVKTGVARTEYTTVAQRHLTAGVWTGEVVFLGLLAGCVAGLLAVTARRSPAGPPALVIGLRTGVAAGLVLSALPPMGHPLHLANPWLAWGYDAARVLTMVAVMGATVAAGMAAARRTSAPSRRLSLADARTRQGVAAGLCAGTAAALLASLLGLITIALLPQEANRLAWTRPYRFTIPRSPQWTHPYRTALPDGVYQFEVGASDSAAGFLSVLVLYPLFGAGLGAWGGLYAADQKRRPGGGGGGGQGPDPVPPPPDDGARRGPGDLPTLLRGGYLRELPLTGDLSPDLPDLEEEPVAPAVTSAYAQSTPRGTLSCADGREPGPEGG